MIRFSPVLAAVGLACTALAQGAEPLYTSPINAIGRGATIQEADRDVRSSFGYIVTHSQRNCYQAGGVLDAVPDVSPQCFPYQGQVACTMEATITCRRR